jgi:hypothetical protein
MSSTLTPFSLIPQLYILGDIFYYMSFQTRFGIFLFQYPIPEFETGKIQNQTTLKFHLGDKIEGNPEV